MSRITLQNFGRCGNENLVRWRFFFFFPSKRRLRRVISPSSFLAAGSAKANHPIWPSGETQSAHTERLDFKGALSNCLYHMWLPNAFRWLLIWLRITIILLSVLCSLSPTHCSGFQSDQNQSNGSLLLKQVWCRAKCLARNGKEAETTAGTSFREPYYTFFFHELKDATRAKRRWILELHSTGGQRKETKGMSVLLCFSWICK